MQRDAIPFAGPKTIGLTGGIGCGKSQVRHMLEALGVPCIDADIVAREIHQGFGHPALTELRLAFPSAITQEGLLAPDRMREIIATDPGANDRLKTILRPHVTAHIRKWTLRQPSLYVVWESALILEEEVQVDRVLVIDTDYQSRIIRIQNRNPTWTREQIGSMIAMQMPRTERIERADDLIYNSSTLDRLQVQVTAMHERYLKMFSLVGA